LNPSRVIELFLCGLFFTQLSGCTSPAQRMDEQAAGLGYRKQVVRGAGYDHVVYSKASPAAERSVLHVYLEGDGTPWLRKQLAASDPTPRNPLMLEFMALDTMPSLYLGRPCYHGLSPAPACTPELWTNRRYSEAVVASMTAALNHLSAGYQSLVLLGYSGGGTLAMLIAERLPKTAAVITIAANLDTMRWAALHAQPPLTGSLNPASRMPLPPHIRQVHFSGGDDDNVPPSLIRDALAHQVGATFNVIEKMGHRCCWRESWPAILKTLPEINVSPMQ